MKCWTRNLPQEYLLTLDGNAANLFGCRLCFLNVFDLLLQLDHMSHSIQ